MIEIEKTYREAGYHCIPTQKNKEPNKYWLWKNPYSTFPESYGIGIACGKISGGIFCLDIDNHFGDAETLIKDYLNIVEVNEIYKKYKLPIQKTSGGGYHLLFKCDTNEGNQKLASRPVEKNGKIVPDAIFETRGNNGYFVAAPTPGYEIIRNDILKIAKITVDERAILISVARSFNEFEEVNYAIIERGDRPGDVYNKNATNSDIAALLESAGWKKVGMYGWRRSGKSEGISATLGKVADNVFYNFSANGHPFEPNKAYSPFQVLALLKYNGDFSLCAKDIAPRETRNEIKPNELNDILNKAKLNLNKKIEKPPVILKILQLYNTEFIEQRLFTLGNFSAITGKSKAKKTYLATSIIAALLSGRFGHLLGNLSETKKKIVSFDTEQSNYDAWSTSDRIRRLIDVQVNYESFALREYSEIQRCLIIDYYLSKNNDIGFVLIDGIADLSKAINDEEEASRVVGLLMKWSKIYNVHICCIIHQNKNDNYATGHLGSSIMKKSEVVISVEKTKEDKRISVVKCDLIRGVMDFDDFNIKITEKGLPEIESYDNETAVQTINFNEPPF